MIIYGVMTETSMPKLYLAGFIPGFILPFLFSLTVLIACLVEAHWGGSKVETSWEERIRTLPDLLPPLVLLRDRDRLDLLGVATATEAAAVGIVGALAITAWRRRLRCACCATCARRRCARQRWWWRSWSARSSSTSSSRRSG